MLDRAPGELFNDNKLLDQTIKAVSLEKGIGYVEALEKLHSGLEMYPRTVRELFLNAGVPDDDVVEDVRLLERADEEASAAYAHDTRQLSQERTNARGMVMLDSDADTGGMVGDPAEFERRFSRARRAAPGMYHAGDDGRERFREDDRLHLDSELDLVRTLERGNELQAAGTRRAQLTRELEQTLAGTADKRARVRLLDSEISKLRVQRDRIAPPAAAPPPSGGLRTLAKPQSDAAAFLDPDLQLQIIDRMRTLDESYEDARLHVLEAAPSATPTPPDELAESRTRQLDQRVRERLTQLGRPDSDYQRTLEEIFAEDRDADMGVIRRGPPFPASERTRKLG